MVSYGIDIEVSECAKRKSRLLNIDRLINSTVATGKIRYCIVFALLILSLSPLRRVISQAIAAPPQTVQSKSDVVRIAFKEELSGRALKKGAVTVSFTNYRSQDGVFLRRSVERYDSETKSSKEFEALLGRAAKIIEKGNKANRSQRKGSERAVVRWQHPDRSNTPLAVFWRDGRLVYILESSSLEHLLSFEEQFYP